MKPVSGKEFPLLKSCERYISNHALGYLCKKTEATHILKIAQDLKETGINHVKKNCDYPLAENNIEEILVLEGIKILDINLPPGTEVSNTYEFLASMDSVKNTIRINREGIGILLKRFKGLYPNRTFSTLDEFCAILLAHEWFHLIFEQLCKPDAWHTLKQAEKIVTEEIAARMFSIELLESELSPFFPEDMHL